jgi:hypothetical protein
VLLLLTPSVFGVDGQTATMEKHFRIPGDLECDVLAGEKRNCCKTIDELPN